MKPASALIEAIESQGFTVCIDPTRPEDQPACTDWNTSTVRIRPGVSEVEATAYLAHELMHIAWKHKENNDANERWSSLQALLLVSEMLVASQADVGPVEISYGEAS